MKRRKIFITVLVALTLGTLQAMAQSFSIGTNLADWANLATTNLHSSYSLDRNWDITGNVKYNPFTYNKGNARQFQHRQFSLAAGIRYWPWHTHSGWFAGSALSYSIYNYGGIADRLTTEGMLYALNFYGGYAFMLTSRINIETGWGFSAGMNDYKRYNCQICGSTISSGQEFLVIPMNIIARISYLF